MMDCGSRWGGCAWARARWPVLSGVCMGRALGAAAAGAGGNKAGGCCGLALWRAERELVFRATARKIGRSPIISGDLAGFAGKSWPENEIRRAKPANDEDV